MNLEAYNQWIWSHATNLESCPIPCRLESGGPGRRCVLGRPGHLEEVGPQKHRENRHREKRQRMNAARVRQRTWRRLQRREAALENGLRWSPTQGLGIAPRAPMQQKSMPKQKKATRAREGAAGLKNGVARNSVRFEFPRAIDQRADLPRFSAPQRVTFSGIARDRRVGRKKSSVWLLRRPRATGRYPSHAYFRRIAKALVLGFQKRPNFQCAGSHKSGRSA